MENKPSLARTNIPDSWAEERKCIWCASRSVRVHHPIGAPDQLVCSKCQLAYEIDTTGRNIFIWVAPKGLPSEFQNSWQYILVIRALAKELQKETPKQRIQIPEEDLAYAEKNAVADSANESLMQKYKSAESQDRVPLTDEEVVKQVTELYSLGNSLEQIKMVLDKRYHYSAEAYQKAVAPLMEQKQRSRKLALQKAIIFLVIVIVMLLIIGFMLRKLFPLIGIIIQQQLTLFGFSS